jgi:hypothetical protein
MKNIYRQTLDITWRQIYRHVTGEEIAAEGGENWADKYDTSCQKERAVQEKHRKEQDGG